MLSVSEHAQSWKSTAAVCSLSKLSVNVKPVLCLQTDNIRADRLHGRMLLSATCWQWDCRGERQVIEWHHVWSKTLEPKRLLTCKVSICGERPEIEKVGLQGPCQQRVLIIRLPKDVSEISILLPVNPLWASSRTQGPFSELHKLQQRLSWRAGDVRARQKQSAASDLWGITADNARWPQGSRRDKDLQYGRLICMRGHFLSASLMI